MDSFDVAGPTATHGHAAAWWLRGYERATKTRWVGIAAGIGLVAILIPILLIAGGYKGNLGPSIPLIFLIPMLVASTLGGRWAGVIVSVVAVFCWDWFFIPPVHTMTVYYPRDLLALFIFLLVAVLTGQLATVVRQRAEDALQRARTTEALYDLSTALIGSHDLSTVLPVLARRLQATFDLQAAVILLPGHGAGAWEAAATTGRLPNELNVLASRNVAGMLAWIAKTGQMTGLGDPIGLADGFGPELSAPNLRRAQFWPLKVGERMCGILELVFRPGTELDPERDRLLQTLVNGVALALEHERLFREEQEAAIARESDLLKSALLSSVSHDLRTPLAGIKAAATSLLQPDIEWSEADRIAFITDIDTEADRLARFVANLLDLSRIEAGALKPIKDWEDPGELVLGAVRRLHGQAGNHEIQTTVDENLPTVCVDPVHLEHAVTNLIENALKYSPAEEPVVVRVRRQDNAQGGIEIAVSDNGPGIPAVEQDRIFDKFYRIAGTGRRTAGTGMGLSIVKGLVEANGGQIAVHSTGQHGSTFTIILPTSSPTNSHPPRQPNPSESGLTGGSEPAALSGNPGGQCPAEHV